MDNQSQSTPSIESSQSVAAGLSTPEPAILPLLHFPEDVLRKLLGLVPCPDRRQLRLCCKQLCILVNPTFNTLLLDRDLQHLLLATHASGAASAPPSSPLSFLARLPRITACTLHPSLNPYHLPTLLARVPSLTALHALPLPLTPDTLPALRLPLTLRSLHLATHLPAVRTPLLTLPRPRPTLTPDPLTLPPLTTITHLTLHCVSDAPAPAGEPLPALRAITRCSQLQSLTLRYSSSSRYILDGHASAHHWLDPLATLPHLATLTLTFDHTCDPTYDPPGDLHLPPLPHLTHLTAQSNALLSSLHNAPALKSLTLLPPRYAYTYADWPTPAPRHPAAPRPHPPLRRLTHLTMPGYLLALPNFPPLPSLQSLTLSPTFERITPHPPFLATLSSLLPHISDLSLVQPPNAPPLATFAHLLTPLLAAHPHLQPRLLAAAPQDAAPPAAVCGSPPSSIQYLPTEEYDTNVQHLRLMWFATCAENDGPDVIYHEKPQVACLLESSSSGDSGLLSLSL